MRLRNFKGENMLSVLADAGRITMPPFGKYLEIVGGLPVFEFSEISHNSGFFGHFALRCFDQTLGVLYAAGD